MSSVVLATAGGGAAAEDASSGAAASPVPFLPPGLWQEILRRLPVLDRFCAALCCKAWREHSLALLAPDLEIELPSGAAAAGFGGWLAVHGHRLVSLHITEFFFSPSRHTIAALALEGAPVSVAGRAVGRVGQVARIALWQGLHGRRRALEQLACLRVRLDDLGPADAAMLGLCNAPALTQLALESNASAIGVAGAAGLAPLTQLRVLQLPTQALGDQGLQILGSSLTGLRYLSVHNDGHVTDDGLPFLAGLSGSLTSLDLQGNVSITNAAMPGLAAALPRLLQLNLSFVSGVNDHGFAQLQPLSNLRDLDLRATGVTLDAAPAAATLRALTALTALGLERCHVGGSGVAVLAACCGSSLCRLSLAMNPVLTSFSQLRVLSSLSSLTRLDVSHRRQVPDAGLSSLAALGQLRHLVLTDVAATSPRLRPRAAAQGGGPAAAPSHLPVLDAGVLASAVAAAAAPVAARLAAASGTAAAAAAAPPGPAPSTSGELGATDADGTAGWCGLLCALPQLAQLTALEFGGNVPWHSGGQQQCGVAQVALLLLGFGAARPPALQLLDVSPALAHGERPPGAEAASLMLRQLAATVAMALAQAPAGSGGGGAAADAGGARRGEAAAVPQPTAMLRAGSLRRSRSSRSSGLVDHGWPWLRNLGLQLGAARAASTSGAAAAVSEEDDAAAVVHLACPSLRCLRLLPDGVGGSDVVWSPAGGGDSEGA